MRMIYVFPELTDPSLDPDSTIPKSVHLEEQYLGEWLDLVSKYGLPMNQRDEDKIWYDSGGATHVNEPEWSHPFNGLMVGCLVRHLEDLEYYLAKRLSFDHNPDGPNLSEHVLIPSFRHSTILTPEHADQLLTTVREALASGVVAQSDQLWEEHKETMKRCGAHTPPRRGE